MTTLDFDEVVLAFEGAGYDVRSYSGRGMYGNECLGVSGDDPLTMVLEAISFYASHVGSAHEVATFVEALRDVRTDQLGLGTIVYFPDIDWEGRADADEE